MPISTNRLRRGLLLPSLLLAALTARAQHQPADYVETAAGDTLRGRLQVSAGAGHQVRLYRPGQEPATFTASQARSYGTGRTLQRIARPVERIGGEPRFLTPLVRGGVSLYAGRNDANQVRYYLQPADSAYVVEVPPERALLTYARLLSNCSSLNIGSEQFAARYRYTSSGLTQLVTDYNRCRQQPAEVVRGTSGLRTVFGLQAGIGRANFRFGSDSYSQELYRTTPTANLSYQVGAIVLLQPRASIGAQLEATYLRLNADYNPDGPANTGTYFGRYGVKLRYSQAQLAAMARYTLFRGWLSPYLLLGPSLGGNFSNNSRKVNYTGFYSSTGTVVVANEEDLNPGFSTLSIGASGGVGVVLRLAGNTALQVDGRYDYQYDDSRYGLEHTAWRLQAGLLF